MSDPQDPTTAIESKLAPKALTLSEQVQSLVVNTPQEEQSAADLLGIAKQGQAQVGEQCDPLCETTHKAWKAAVAFRKRMLKPWEDAEAEIKRRLGGYRQNVQKALEEERLRREREARVEADRRALELAQQLEAQGEDAAAQEVLEEAVTAPLAVPPPPPPPKADGVSYRKSWDFEVLDAGRLKPAYVLADGVKLRAVVKSMGMTAVNVVSLGPKPAIRVFETTGVASRR